MGYIIRDMGLDDLDQVYSIEVRSFPAPFSKEIFLKELSIPFAKLKVIVEQGVSPIVRGYIDYWFVADEVHLLNLAVDPEFRRKGLANSLMEVMIEDAKRVGQKSIYLEVRQSNFGAQDFYRKLGFKDIGIRKGYYVETNEDALVMEKEIF